jgi:hypothetical protein
VCNLLGLLCSVVGVLLLFYNVLPTPVPGEGTSLTADDADRSLWEAEYRRHDRNAHRGLVLVIIGTLMEAVPPLCTAIGSWRRRPIAPQVPRREEEPHMPKTLNEIEIEKLTEELVSVGNIGRADQLLAIVQVQAAEAQKAAANAAQNNARYMLWSVSAAAISAVLTAAGIAFSIFRH